jgi:hypothetical protein
LKTLLNDTIRLKKLHQHLITCDPTTRINQGMERTFGHQMKTIEKDIEQDDSLYAKYLDWLSETVLTFIKSK